MPAAVYSNGAVPVYCWHVGIEHRGVAGAHVGSRCAVYEGGRGCVRCVCMRCVHACNAHNIGFRVPMTHVCVCTCIGRPSLTGALRSHRAAERTQTVRTSSLSGCNPVRLSLLFALLELQGEREREAHIHIQLRIKKASRCTCAPRSCRKEQDWCAHKQTLSDSPEKWSGCCQHGVRIS